MDCAAPAMIKSGGSELNLYHSPLPQCLSLAARQVAPMHGAVATKLDKTCCMANVLKGGADNRALQTTSSLQVFSQSFFL